MIKKRKKEFPVQDMEARAAGVSSDYGVPHPEQFSDLIEAFSVHTWVYACANLIANAFSMIEFIPYKPGKDGSWEVNEKHPFRKILNHPNPNMSGMEFKRLLSLSSKLTGNAFIITEPGNTKAPLELWPLQPNKVQVTSDTKNFISGYVYTVNGDARKFSPDRIIHIREATPTNLQYGQGSLTAVKNAVTSDLLADAWNRFFFGNSARPDAVLESQTPLSDVEMKRAVLGWKKNHEGSKNVSRIAVLSGLKYIEVNRMHKDMDFVNLRKMLREEILAAFGVPQSMVGILDQANYSNMKEQTKTFWNQTMIPEIRKFESIMTMRAAQITGDTTTVIQADLSKVEALREDEASKAFIAQTYINMGVPLGQVVEALDLPFDIPADYVKPIENPYQAQPMDEEKAMVKKKDVPKDVQLGDPRAIEWKKFDRDVRPFEQQMESSLRAFFRSQGKRVLNKFAENLDVLVPKDGKGMKTEEDQVNYIFNFDVEKDILGRVVEKKIRDAYFAFAVRTANRIGVPGSGVTFNVDESEAGAWIARKVLKLQQEATRFTREQLSDALVEGVRDATATGLSRSETIDQIKERITEIYDFAANGRAERIARTEVIGASNAGSFQAMKQLGAVKKEWITSRDSLVRETHDQMDGQQVKIGDPFQSPDGGMLQFPGDPSGAPGEIINCRCSYAPIMED